MFIICNVSLPLRTMSLTQLDSTTQRLPGTVSPDFSAVTFTPSRY
jgi:hypothetical protein